MRKLLSARALALLCCHCDVISCTALADALVCPLWCQTYLISFCRLLYVVVLSLSLSQSSHCDKYHTHTPPLSHTLTPTNTHTHTLSLSPVIKAWSWHWISAMLSSPHILRNKTKQPRIEKNNRTSAPVCLERQRWRGWQRPKSQFKPGSRRSKSGRTNDRNMTDNYNYLVQAEIFMFFAKPVITY